MSRLVAKVIERPPKSKGKRAKMEYKMVGPYKIIDKPGYEQQITGPGISNISRYASAWTLCKALNMAFVAGRLSKDGLLLTMRLLDAANTR